jgi:hypothetical protein
MHMARGEAHRDWIGYDASRPNPDAIAKVVTAHNPVQDDGPEK